VRIKQCFAVLIYRRRLSNYVFIGMGVFRAFLPRSGLCRRLRVGDVLVALAAALGLLCDVRQ